MSKKPDIAIQQDTKIIQQILKGLPKGGDGAVLNNISIGQLVVNSGPGDGIKTPADATEAMTMLEKILDILPDPKLENLKLLAYEVARKRKKTQNGAADWLGVSVRAYRDKTKLLMEA